MPTLREFFNPGKVISSMGALKFDTSVFKDQIRYPNWEMDQCLKIYSDRPQVNSGIKQYCRFILGEEVKAVSEDEKSQDFLQKWIDQRKNLMQEIFNFTIMTVVTGNGYLEPTYTKAKNGVAIIDNLFNVPDPSRIYYNLDNKKTDDEFWLFEVPIEVKMFPFQGEEYKPKFYRVNYIRGSILFQRLVYAIPVHKSKLLHCKIGWSRDGIYGRSFLASAIDDAEILFEILKNLAIISRTRALNTKLISIGTENDRATIEDMNKLDFDLKNRKESEHILINKPVSELNMSHQGRYDKMDSSIDFLRKDISSGLVPNFITPWNNEINRATAGETKIPFQMELNSYKENILQFLSDTVVDSLRKAYSFLAEDLRFEFGIIDLTSTEEKMAYAQAMFRDNVMTMNEYRLAAGYDRVDGGDIWGYEMPSLPLEQIRVTDKQEDTPTDVPGATQAQGYRPKPNVPKERKKSVKRTLKEIPKKPGLRESEKGTMRLEEDLTGEDLFTELYRTNWNMEEEIQKLGLGTKIKTTSDKGSRLPLVQKTSKSKIQNMLSKLIGKNLRLKKSAGEFYQELKDEVQKYKRGDPKFQDYVLERIARTELANAREMTKLLRWKAEGYTKVRHITHLSAQTAQKDRSFNGRIFEIDYLLKNGEDRIPLHPNCRCVYIPAR